MSSHKKDTRWQIALAAALITASAGVYGLHYLVRHDSGKIIDYLLLDTAFVPIEVLLVTLIIHRVLEAREKKTQLSKMNIVLTAFFVEAGTELLRRLNAFDTEPEATRAEVGVRQSWSDADYASAVTTCKAGKFHMDAARGDLSELLAFAAGKRQTLMRLLENPILMEHDSFTDMLWAISHMTDELSMRPTLTGLPRPDMNHLSGDLQRAYSTLLCEWVHHMRHLKKDYPYMFSLAVRSNPFDDKASVTVTE